jgi:translation initiation factor IF-3
VCRVTDYGKFLYHEKKKRKAATQRTSRLKEIRLRPKTGGQDLQTKLRRTADMLSKGDRVRLVMRLRGRERGLIGRWTRQLQGWIAEIPQVGRTFAPDVQGRSISVILEPAREPA